MYYFLFYMFFTFTFCDDVHIWISSTDNNQIELSIKSTQKIFGFDFQITANNDDVIPIDYSEEFFSNGNFSESLYTIDTGQGMVNDNNFTCFTNANNRFLGLSLENNFLPVSDSTMMMTIPLTVNQSDLSYSISNPSFFSKDENYNLINLEVEYGLIEYQVGWPFDNTDKILGDPAITDINQDGFVNVVDVISLVLIILD